MTITFPHETNDHHVRQTAIAVTLVVILTAVGLTFWQGASVSSVGSNGAVETAEVEPFSPEKARANAAVLAAPVEAFSPEKARVNAAATASIGTTTRGNGHPDIRTATQSEATIPPVANTMTPLARFAAFDAPKELKEYALAQSVSDEAVDLDKAVQILQDFARLDFSQRSEARAAGAQETALDQLPSNCTYWGICGPE